MTDLNIALILRLVDRATGPARAALQNVERFSNAAGQAGLRNLEVADRLSEGQQRRTQAMMGEAQGLIGLGLGLVALTEPAIQAERRMAEVSKAVSFTEETGIAQLQREIRELVTSGGLMGTSEGIMDIVAAAGRMGVVDENLPDAEKRRQLLQFAEAASVMAGAFGVSADMAGETLSRWRKNLGLTQEDAMLLGDTVNLLGNTMATNEADILTVLNKQAVLAEVSGLATNEIAALSATLLAAGASPEIAATGMKNFLAALTGGTSLSTRQRAVFEEIGIDAEEMARLMQEDATEGMLSVLDALNEMEPHRRTSLVSDLFGQEGVAAIIPLVANTNEFRDALEATANSAELLGLMQDEYNRQVETTFAQRQRLMNYFTGLSTVIGNQVLPQLNELMETIMPVVGQITAWAEANPELVATIVKVAAGLFAMKAALLAIKLLMAPVIGLAIRAFRAFAWLQIVVGGLGRGLALIPAALGLVRGGLVLLARVVTAHPILALITAIAYGVDAIYQNWDGFVAYFTDKIDRVKAAFQDGLINSVFVAIAEFNGFTLLIDAAEGFFAYLFGQTFDEFTAPLRAAFDIDLYQMGVDMITSLGAGAKSVLITLVSELQALLASIVPQWMQDGLEWAQGGATHNGPSSRAGGTPEGFVFEEVGGVTIPVAVPAPEPGRATGGPVRSGFMYRINENGTETLQPYGGASGTILNAGQTRSRETAVRRSASLTVGDINIYPTPGMNAADVARAVRDEIQRLGDTSTDLHDGALYD